MSDFDPVAYARSLIDGAVEAPPNVTVLVNLPLAFLEALVESAERARADVCLLLEEQLSRQPKEGDDPL